MKKLSFIAICLVFLAFVSCARKDIAYEKTYSFDDKVITNEKPLQFVYAHDEDTFQLYTISLLIKHMPKISYTQLPLNLKYIAPTGISQEITIAIPVYDKNYKAIGKEQKDGTFLLEAELYGSERLLEGENTFEITPATLEHSLDGICSMTLRIERVN